MAGKGGSSHLKRLAAPRYAPVARKRFVWLAKPMPGPHPGEESMALLALVRDVLGLADNGREARKIIRGGGLLVDGRAVKRERFPIGLMDVVSIPLMGKHYRVLIDSHGRMKLAEIPEKDAAYKLCKIERKSCLRGNEMQAGLHDGRNIIAGKEMKVGDTVKLAVPGQKLLGVMRLEPDARCLIVKGKHAGTVATVAKIHPRTSRRDPEATVKSDGSEFITVKKYLFVVGNEMGQSG